MCGIVGALGQRDVAPILLEGLKRLEYRGYDSAGIAVVRDNTEICRLRVQGKVKNLAEKMLGAPHLGSIGVAHTRWATHGSPSEKNAHPHVCKNNKIALVHNGIIENHETMRSELNNKGYDFRSDTDTEVIVHSIHKKMQDDSIELFFAVQETLKELEGAYALGVIHTDDPGRLIAARHGSPLVIGLGIGENFIASDVFALLPVTQRFIFLEDGDIAVLTRNSIDIFDRHGNKTIRPEKISNLSSESTEKGHYRHYMLKEIYEQPNAIAETLEGRTSSKLMLPECLGHGAEDILKNVMSIQIVACGTSYHAGLVSKYWFEALTGLPCNVEVASEFRYRKHVVLPYTLLVTISQSGETADTLSALKLSKQLGYYKSLAICNVPESSLVRESDLVLLTHAGPEIGVASTKAFTTQLVALLLLVTFLGRYNGLKKETENSRVSSLRALPRLIEQTLGLDDEIKHLAESFADKHHCLFLGRGDQYPIAMEGALKLKEISYIHAEAYPSGELKHGPIALIDDNMPVIAVAPDNKLLEKLKSNLEEVRARGGELIIFADERVNMKSGDGVTVIKVPQVDGLVAPILFTIPLQLLAYHVAVLKGTDVDQPRNLAKSVTVE